MIKSRKPLLTSESLLEETTRDVNAAPAPVAATPAGFGAANTVLTTTSNTAAEGVDAFAEAINARYSRAGTSLIPLSPNHHGSTSVPAPLDQPGHSTQPFTPTMPPNNFPPSNAPLLSLHLPRSSPSPTVNSPLKSPPAAPPPSSSSPRPTMPTPRPTTTAAAPLNHTAFTALTPSALPSVLTLPTTLILDIRPHNAYAIARLPTAISLSVPSTLLKRPLFSLDRLAQMLSPSTRTRFSTWPTAAKILVYDADSTSLAEGGNILGLLRKLRKEGYAGEVCWVKGGFKAIWREQYDLVDQSAPADEEDEEGELPRAPTALAVEPGVGEMSRTISAPATTSSFPSSLPPSMLLRTNKLPMSAFDSSTTTSQRPYRPGERSSSSSSSTSTQSAYPASSKPGVRSSFALPTPTPARGDPFASLGSAASTSSLPGTSPGPASGGQPSPFALRLPPALARAPASASTSTIPEGKELLVFPSRLGVSQAGTTIDTASSLPTQGAGAAYGMVPRERPHYKSFPGVGVSEQSVPFNPFFDTIRQNLELGGGRGSGEGIPLRLSKRVRRRVGDLPFEWLREIARRSGKASADSEDTDSDKEIGLRKRKVLSVAARAALGSSDVSESEDELAGTHHHRRRRSLSKLHKTVLHTNESSPASSPDSTSSTDGEELAKILAMQFYKIELGEQRRLMGVMEHHSMESGTIVGESGASAAHVAKISQAASKSATIGGFSLNQEGIPSGGLCGPVPTLPGGARIAPSEPTNKADKPGQTYTGTAAARMLSVGVDKGGIAAPAATEARSVQDREKAFPFSITAGVEKGDKNRYRNIWPFEHARVRLHKSRPEDDDYMNASYVQPLGTTKRYIATQGPLPATFKDFWTLCWQENVHVIVMLTREVESALVKCGNYWTEGQYGPLRLKLVSTNDTPERERRRRESEMSSGFFNIPQARSQTKDELEDQTIRRVFELTHSGYPRAPPRMVTQLQYLDWPDLDVPKDPRGLLKLMQEVDSAVEESRSKGVKQWGEGPLKRQVKRRASPSEDPKSAVSSDSEADPSEELDKDNLDPMTGVAYHALENPPVLLHCSAGVGRTGGFIAVDAVLDGIRREMRKRKEDKSKAEKLSSGSRSPVSSATRPSGSQSPVSGESDEPMEVDVRSSASASPRPTGEDPISVSVSVGVDREDLPPAARSSQQEPMQIDSDIPVTNPPAQAHGIIKPSIGLISELRRQHAHLTQTLSQTPAQGRDYVGTNSPPTNVVLSAPQVLSPLGSISETGSVGSLASGRRSTSTFAPSTSTSRAGTGSISSSKTGSTSSLNSFVKSVEALVPDDHGHRPSSMSTTAATAGSETSQNVAPVPAKAEVLVSNTKVKGGMEPSRFNSWRSGVQDNRPHHTTDEKPVMEKLPHDKALPTPRTMAFDYTSPRPLHDDASPLLLSTYDEPIRHVIDDMRKQRMSLCQSLRQYVFVHRVIIEGALMIVDEERKREEEGMLGSDKESSTKESTRESSADAPEERAKPTTTTSVRRTSFALGIDKGKEHMSALHIPAHRLVSVADVHMNEHQMLQPSPALPSPRSKRQASPTELVQEDLSGGERLMKRPSVKRKARLSSEEDGSLLLNAMVLSSPPSGGE